MKHKLLFKIAVIVFGACCLALIRFYETSLFYDPLIDFYNGRFHLKPFPELKFWAYNLNLTFRYLLNTLVSIGIIWYLFKNKTYIKFSVLIYIAVFIIGLITFWIIADNIQSKDFMLLFYIRRFLIQPILVIVLIPAFYFQKLNKKGHK